MSPREAVARAGSAAASALAHPARPVAGGGAPGRAGPRLTVVPRGSVRPPRAPFVLLVAALLVCGLGGLLMLNTTLAQGSFRLQDLQARSSALQGEEQALNGQVALEATPQRLAARATALGMVPSINPVFIRISDGAILGRPEAAKAAPRAAHQTATAPAKGAKPTVTPTGHPVATVKPAVVPTPKPHR